MTIRQLPQPLQLKAIKELNEDPQRLPLEVTPIKEWMKKQPHLKYVQPTDQWIVAFLRGCKFSPERTKKKIDLYYTLKSVVPEFFSNRDPLDNRIQEILKLGVFLPVLKCKEIDSPRVNIVRVGLIDPSCYNLSDLIKVSFMITEIQLLEDDNFTIAGEEVIVDMKNVGFSVLSMWTPALAKKVITCFEKGLPIRMKGSHILNTPRGFQTVFSILKRFLGKKIRKRFLVHNKKYEELHKIVPKCVLPPEYQGEDKSVQELIDYWKKKVESYRDWFLKEETGNSSDCISFDKEKITSNLFGVETSFQTLEVD